MRRRATDFILVLLAAAGLVSAASETPRDGYELYFWKGGDFSTDKRVLYEDGHPCTGTVLIARVTRVPDGDDPVLKPEEVREIDARGVTIGRWRVPTDAYPVAIRGQRLLFGVGSETRLWVDREGLLSKALASDPAQGQVRSCPFNVNETDQATHTCEVVSDLADNKPRYILFPVVCT